MKIQTKFVCQECGTWHPKWSGKCEGCGAWNTLLEEHVQVSKKSDAAKTLKLSLTPLNTIKADFDDNYRLKTGISELDRVCGGGIVPDSVILVGGDPGIGKSTLLLQAIANLAKHHVCAYVSGEEALMQIRLRADRLGLQDSPAQMMSATQLADVLATLKTLPDLKLVVIDSIQTMMWRDIDSAAGSVSQVRACTHELIQFAKSNDVSVILVGHVTKEGTLAGPRVLEHMVDCVLYFEGERNYDYRILRSVKNRFGATDEIGVFAMVEKGLACVDNPSALFLSHHEGDSSGTAIFAGVEGTRPILCEIQALVAQSYFAAPKRNTVGYDQNRLSMILAVLETRCGMVFGNKDVYLNVAGGLKLTEPGADLAVAAALISALKNESLPASAVYFGEIGLSGEVRSVAHMEPRVKEAEKLGFEKIFCAKPRREASSLKTSLEMTPLSYLLELV